VTDPASAGLSLVTELRRMQLRALVLVHRAKSARVHAQESVKNTKAGASTPAKKEVYP
jgi:hypothetical protein